ncbi:leiomodin-2a isoform X2 [Melanotaenia boesemani]|uniref:leiomodin-2a isoform X2 n=1 Tax=Melanotaenia boesemani TaxID=1250792 RepID=UPI001C05B604|nr:leiomodin-2a isoform X2 [Melanotaenia boesemani]
MSTFGYRRKLDKYEEVDEDNLLATLSSEELQELERELADLDPDDNIPIGLRQKDQTTRDPTMTFDRDALLKYWEDTKNELEEKVESRAVQEGEPDKSLTLVNTTDVCEAVDRAGKTILYKGRRFEKCVFDRRGAKEDEMERGDDCTKSLWSGLSKGLRRTETTSQKLGVTPESPSVNPTVISKALEQILSNDPNMTEVNLNNIDNIPQDTLLSFAEALCVNNHVHVFSLANTHADDRVAFAIAKMLLENHSIKNLNIESNFVSGQGILALIAALQHNSTLVELRFHNQRHIFGGKVEMEMVQLLSQNTTLLKLGYQFDLPGPRMTATTILTRNQDQQRQRRLQQKKTVPSPTETSPENKPLDNSSQQRRNPSFTSLEPPTRKIAELVKQREGSSSIKAQLHQRKPKMKKVKNSSNEKESAVIFKELKNSLKPSLQKRHDEHPNLQPPLRSTHDDLMAAIRGSSVSSLKRVDLPQT